MILHKTVDNYVGNVYKGHHLFLSFLAIFIQNMLLNKDILIKDIKLSKTFHVTHLNKRYS
jgi:hypothetical protein